MRHVIKCKITPKKTIRAVITPKSTIHARLHIPETIGSERYQGEYEFTPSESTQVVQVADKTAMQDIVINPIPSNYGCISWDGRCITVS